MLKRQWYYTIKIHKGQVCNYLLHICNVVNIDGFLKSPISAEASLRACVALHPVAIAAP
jgi:hypothetical protein